MSSKLGPYLLGPNDTPENGIYHGDARELAKEIPDSSIDLVFTDPVYQNTSDYEWLAITAARVLKDGGSVLAWSGTPTLPETIQCFTPYLSWAWCLYWNRSTDKKFYHGRTGITVITPCLWFEKGRAKRHANIADMIRCGWEGSHSNHQWSKPPRVINKWLAFASQQNAVVLDPFCGGGTVPASCIALGRNYLAFEIDKDTCTIARDRVRNTQPPLFIQQAEQPALPLG